MLKNKVNLQLFADSKENEGAKKVDEVALLKAQIEEMKKEAKKNKDLAEKLQKEATARANEAGNEKVDSIEEYLEQRVPIMLYKDGEKYKDDVVIAVNGEKIQIQRGIQVYIKRKFLSIIENQYRQQMVSANLQEQLAEEFAEESKRRGFSV